MHGGAADRSGLISCGDEVIEVNGVNVEGKTPNDVLKILVRISFSLSLIICYEYYYKLCFIFHHFQTIVFCSNQRKTQLLLNSFLTKENKLSGNQEFD